MSFVEWVIGVSLLVVALGGGYAGVVILRGGSAVVLPREVEGLGTLLLALLYLAGGVVALMAFLLLFLAKSF